jgi:cell division protein FtsL
MERVEKFTQAYREPPWRRQMQIVGVFAVVLILFALVATIYLNVTSRAALIGRDIQAMNSDIEDTALDISNLRAQLASISVSDQMERRAKALGFQPINNDETLFIAVPNYIDRRPAELGPATAPAIAPQPAIPAEYTESLFVWMRRQLANPAFSLSMKGTQP